MKVKQSKSQQSSQGKANSKSSRSKSKFRSTSTWKNFRQLLRKERRVDEITLQPLRAGFQVHHMILHGRGSDEESYQDLSDKKNFRCYQAMTHRVIHWLFNFYKKDPTILDRIKSDLEIMMEMYRD